MLKKRIAGVVVVRNGWAVQSFGYQRYLPLGHPECLVENLDRWGADEIIVLCIDRTSNGLGPDLALLKRLAALGLSTPLTFGGGISTVEAASAVIQSGADRICIDAVVRDNPDAVRGMATLLGAQAIVASLPSSIVDGTICWRDYRSRSDAPFRASDLRLLSERVVSEAMMIDWQHEGCERGFDRRLVDSCPVEGVPLIAFGGLTDQTQIAELLSRDRVVACGIGNFLAYREHAVQWYRRAQSGSSIRPPEFKVETWQ